MKLVDELRGVEVESLRSELQAGRRDHILKTLDERGGAQELVRQQYSGRYPFELLQNANDAAAEAGRPGRALFVLTSEALLVADNGTGFHETQIRAICTLGRSSKEPGKSVGYKGLGFKSVGEITDRPQVISGDESFEFDEARVFDLVATEAGELPSAQRLPIYAFLFDVSADRLGRDATEVGDIFAEGYATVLRLPLKSGVERTQVEKHLLDNLVPRLLLFLPAVDELEVRGTRSDFSAVVSREVDGIAEHVLLETNGHVAEWLVYRHQVHADASLMTAMGEDWEKVDTVGHAIAVPIDDKGVPAPDRVFPLHVYFPTDEQTGFPVAIHADFALHMDRRQLATTPEATPYNEMLMASIARHLAQTVAPDLSHRSRGSGAGVAAVTPLTAANGLGARIRELIIEGLRTARFLPGVDGQLHLPGHAITLPASVPNPAQVHRFANLTGIEGLVAADISDRPATNDFLVNDLRVPVLRLAEVLGVLTPPPAEHIADFYAFLVDWRERHGHGFVAALKSAPCVLTTTGDVVAPADRVFFPRTAAGSAVAVDLPVPIAVIPEVVGVSSLLREAGVRPFEWRDLLTDYLLPILTDPDADESLRKRALDGVRTYHASQRGGDDRLRTNLGRILLLARTVHNTQRALRPANQVYFGTDWAPSAALEEIYGPFGNAEFLATPAPTNEDHRRADLDFYTFLGVAARPRVLTAETEQRDSYMVYNFARHPHRGPAFNAWAATAATRKAAECSQGHSQSQQLRASHQLDRFAELCDSQDPVRLHVLWHQLARRWGSVYEPAMRAVFHCQHTNHVGDRDRVTDSVLAWQLRTRSWVPAQRGGHTVLVAPSQAWRPAPDTPRRIRERVPMISSEMYASQGASLAAALDLTDAARPTPLDLLELLSCLADEFDHDPDSRRETELAARWAQRMLNDVLPPDAAPHPEPDRIRLLARCKGETAFVAKPLVATDPLLRSTWQEQDHLLDADSGLTRLASYFSLTRLDDVVTTRPQPYGPRPDLAEKVSRILNRAKPFMLAVARADNATREGQVLRGLRTLEVQTCDELVLLYTYNDKTVRRDEAVAHLAVRSVRLRGAVSRNIATAHLEIDPTTQEPHWFSLGPQLAQYLGVPGLSDAFAMLMAASDDDRHRYLTSKQIPPEDLTVARNLLDLPPLDDDANTDDLIDLTFTSAPVEDSDDAFGAAPTNHAQAQDTQTSLTEERRDQIPPEPPDLDTAALTIHEAALGPARLPGTNGAAKGSGHNGGPVTVVESDDDRRRIGERGERAAYEAERRRLHQLGYDPDLVTWRSRTDPYAPHDIESMDEDGQRIYIEVKSTRGDDPAETFYISNGELLEAVAQRGRYYVYRVTLTDTARPRITRFADPIGLVLQEKALLRLADARMSVGVLDASSADAAP